MNAREQGQIETVTDLIHWSDHAAMRHTQVYPFEEASVLSGDAGFRVTLRGGMAFQVTVVRPAGPSGRTNTWAT